MAAIDPRARPRTPRATALTLALVALGSPSALPEAAQATEAAATRGLPPAVARTREALLRLASHHDYDGLARLALAPGKGFVYHLGFEQRRPAAYWRQRAARGEAPLLKLVALMRLRPVQSRGVFLWPAAAMNPDETAWADLKGLYPATRIERFRQEGYTGWRTGIDAQGRWTMFLAGS
ncbi:MAG: hypothetical protein VKS61_14040 [Candidatus Sericytochromatia bacterium]|nr:hypothetical protein [Candidatus Sericytochromatia bacterium]